MRNVRYLHTHEVVSGPKDNVYVTVTFKRSGETASDSQFQVEVSIN